MAMSVSLRSLEDLVSSTTSPPAPPPTFDLSPRRTDILHAIHDRGLTIRHRPQSSRTSNHVDRNKLVTLIVFNARRERRLITFLYATCGRYATSSQLNLGGDASISYTSRYIGYGQLLLSQAAHMWGDEDDDRRGHGSLHHDSDSELDTEAC